MKALQLTKGYVAYVSDEDYERASAYKWTASLESRGTKVYAIRWSTKAEHGSGKRYKIRLHRWLLGLPAKDMELVVDHVDGDALNNTRDNLEIVTQSENMHRVATWKGSRSYRAVASA